MGITGIFVTGMILLTGCGSSSETKKQNKNERNSRRRIRKEDKVQIGLTVDSFVYRKDGSATEMYLLATARELGAEVNVQDAGGRCPKSRSVQIEYFIKISRWNVIVVIARRLWSTFQMPLQKGTECGNSGLFPMNRMVQ